MALFDIQAPDLPGVIARFARQPAAQHARMVRVMHDAAALVESQAKANIARLFNHPDRMQDTLDATVVDGAWTVTGTVSASGLPYLRIQEYGGIIHVPEISGKLMHWMGPPQLGFSGGGAREPHEVFRTHEQEDVFATHAAAHDVRLPERSYLRAALAQRRAEIISAFQGTVAFSP